MKGHFGLSLPISRLVVPPILKFRVALYNEMLRHLRWRNPSCRVACNGKGIIKNLFFPGGPVGNHEFTKVPVASDRSPNAARTPLDIPPDIGTRADIAR